jgi:hypothetical protein
MSIQPKITCPRKTSKKKFMLCKSVTQQRQRQEDHRFEDSLGYLVRLCLKKTKGVGEEKKKAGGVAQVVKCLNSNFSTSKKKKS